MLYKEIIKGRWQSLGICSAGGKACAKSRQRLSLRRRRAFAGIFGKGRGSRC